MDISWFTAVAAFVIACVTLAAIKRFVKKITYKFPPGPPQLPIIGNAHNVDSGDIHKSLWDHRDKYGHFSWISMPGKNIVVLNTIKAVREALLSDHASPVMNNRPESFFGRYILQGDVAFRQYSDDWKTLRRTTHNGIYSTINGSEETVAMDEEMECLKSAFREHHGMSFDPRKYLSLTTINFIIISLISRRLDYDHRVFELYLEYDRQATALFTPTARVLLDMIPAIRCLPFGYGLHFRKLQEVKEQLAKYLLYDVECESDIDRQTKSGIIYELLRAKREHASITDENIKSIILDVYSAGIVSIRASLFAIFYHLLHHPRVQAKIFQEIVTVIGRCDAPRMEHKKRLPYTEAAILESMRLTTVVPVSVPRATTADVRLADYHIPQGTIFMSNHWRIHHDDEFWDDPWSFKPERFLDTSGNLLPADHRMRRAVVPFGMGQRSCLGESLAMSRIFLCVANICQSFEIHNDVPEELGSEVDARQYTKDTVMYVPEYKIQVRERE